MAWPCLCLGLALLLPGPSPAQSDEKQTRRQLQQLEQDIARINRDIKTDSGRRGELQAQLRSAEVELGQLQREVEDTRKAIAEGERELSDLQQRREKLEQARREQQAHIASELRAAWHMGRQGQLKVLLSQQSPHTVSRSLGYYRYLFDARSTALDTYRETLQQIAALGAQIDTRLAELAERGAALAQQQQQLAAAQAERQRALAELNASIDSNAAALEQKQADRKKLESLLQAIEEAVEQLAPPDNLVAFASARGKMPWPVSGKASNHFGRPRNEGKMRWQGVTIPAEEGSTVRAIHHGRVVYADWLRGSGLLLIIDHGDGYMSLYAHNQSLLKDVGEWVAAGDPVSTVGSSGGQERAALYFEVRHNGKPVDPAPWCRG